MSTLCKKECKISQSSGIDVPPSCKDSCVKTVHICAKIIVVIIAQKYLLINAQVTLQRVANSADQKIIGYIFLHD